MAATPDGGGYWEVSSTAGCSPSVTPPRPATSPPWPASQGSSWASPRPVTGGYWLVGSDGGVFSFGAPFFGSTGAIHLNQPVVAMQSTSDGLGYWFVASDGGVFS